MANVELNKYTDAQLVEMRNAFMGVKFDVDLFVAEYKKKEGANLPDSEISSIGNAITARYAQIAKHLSDEEWIALLRDGVKPDLLPVAPRQLEALKGGDGTTAGAGAVAGAIVGTCVGGPLLGAVGAVIGAVMWGLAA